MKTLGLVLHLIPRISITHTTVAMQVRTLKRIYTILFFITSFCIVTAHAQDFSFIKYDIRDGLGASVVYDALQDSEGFMWFATENGLSRFDGKNFKTFTTKDGLPDNEILKLFLDSKGRLWIMPFRPSVCYYYKGKIYTQANDSLLSKITLFNHAFDMAEDNLGNIFIIEMRSWHSISSSGEITTVNKLDKALMSINATGINANGEVEMLVSTNVVGTINRHYLVHTRTGTIEPINERPDWSDISTSLIAPNYILIAGKDKLRERQLDGNTRVLWPKLPGNTVNINYINERKIVINTRTGIQFFDPQTKAFSNLLFKNVSVNSAFEDKEANLWLTTTGQGVLMVPSFEFRNIVFNEKNPEVTALFIKADTLYAGGWGERYWKLNTGNLKYSDQHSLLRREGKIISILPIGNRLIITSSTDYEPHCPIMTANGMALKFASRGPSGIAYATHRNAWLNKLTGEYETIWDERSTCVVEKDSGFYIGTLNGLYFRSYAGKITNLDKKYPVFSSRIAYLAVSDKNLLWVATQGNGVIAYASDRILYHFTEADGLTSDNCISLYLDGNSVWLGTDKGVSHIEFGARRPIITRFSMSDGLPSNLINTIAVDGKKVFVGTPMGLTYFQVDKISQTSTCDLQVTGILINDKYWVYDTASFSVPHRDNDVRFEYSGISFKSAGEIIYQYRVLGLQPDWRTTTEGQMNFPSLSSGKYVFQLRAFNKYGVQSSLKEVSFEIQKLLWEETWFRATLILILVGAVWILFRYRVRYVRSKEKEKSELNQRIADLEQKTLRSQMNPHFIFNSLNSIQQYVVERDITGANSFITDFSKLIRMTLDLSTHASISLAEEIDYIATYLRIEKTRLEGQFDYCINVDESLDPKEIYVPPLLLQPYLENSIRHGIRYKQNEKGLIKISIRKKKSDVLVSIEDNGIGREAAQKYKSKFHIQYQSKGMTINKDRIDILNRYNEKKINISITDLFGEGDRPAGTRVDIYLKQ